MDSYILQWTATVRGCGIQSQGGPTTRSGSERSFVISNLEEDSTLSVTITALNIRGSASVAYNTNTYIASELLVVFVLSNHSSLQVLVELRI